MSQTETVNEKFKWTVKIFKSLVTAEWTSRVWFHSCVCLRSNQLVAKVAVRYKLCVSTKPRSHSAGFDAGMGPRDNSWKALKGLWTLAVFLQCSVGGSTYQRPQQPKSSPGALEYVGPTPWPTTQWASGACWPSPKRHFSTRCIPKIW